MKQTAITDDALFQESIEELAVEMIKVTLMDMKKGVEYKGIPIASLGSYSKQHLAINYNAALGWLEDGNRSFLSFQWCCKFLKVSPEKIRNGIYKRIEKEKS